MVKCRRIYGRGSLPSARVPGGTLRWVSSLLLTACESCAYTVCITEFLSVIGNGTEIPGLQESGIFCILYLPLFC